MRKVQVSWTNPCLALQWPPVVPSLGLGCNERRKVQVS